MEKRRKAQKTGSDKTKGTTKKKIVATVDERLNSAAQLKLNDSEKALKMFEAVKAAFNKRSGISDVREILNEAEFNGICLRMILNMEKETLSPQWLVTSEQVKNIADWMAKQQNTDYLLNDSIRKSEEEYLKKIHALYDGARDAFHKDDGGKSLISFLREEGEGNSTVIIYLTARERDDLILGVNWKYKMQGRAAMTVHFRPAIKTGLEKSISDLHMSGLLDGIGGATAGVIEEALTSMIRIMDEFKVRPSDIWEHACHSLDKARRGDKLFTQEEVRRLIHEDDAGKRLELYDKMRDFKTETHRTGYPWL